MFSCLSREFIDWSMNWRLLLTLLMLHFDDILHIILLSTMDLTAITINFLFIYIIKRKTPASLHSYSILLFTITSVDLLAAFSSFMTIISVYNIGGTVVLTYIGPCTLFSPHVCHLFLAIRVNLLGQSVLLLMISFAFRFWILTRKATDGKPNFSCRLWTASLISIALALSNIIAIFLAGSYELPELGDDDTFSVLPLAGGITDNLLPRISVFAVIIIDRVGFASIVVIRRKLFLRIKNLKSADRHSHQMIYRSLTAQMLLPLAYILGTSLWMLDLVSIVHSRTLQRGTFILSSIFGIGSPLINMFYIPPYRVCVSCSDIFPQRTVQISSITVSPKSTDYSTDDSEIDV